MTFFSTSSQQFDFKNVIIKCIMPIHDSNLLGRKCVSSKVTFLRLCKAASVWLPDAAHSRNSPLHPRLVNVMGTKGIKESAHVLLLHTSWERTMDLVLCPLFAPPPPPPPWLQVMCANVFQMKLLSQSRRLSYVLKIKYHLVKVILNRFSVFSTSDAGFLALGLL